MIHTSTSRNVCYIWPALIALAGTAYSAYSSKKQAGKQMDFQREMSDTAHQREVKDLQAAGLNPILSAGGKGASTPAGAMAPVPNMGVATASAMMQAKQTESNVQLQDANTAKTISDTNPVEYWRKIADSLGLNIDTFAKNYGIDLTRSGDQQDQTSAKPQLSKYMQPGFERKTSRPKHTFKSKWENPLKGRKGKTKYQRRNPTYKDNPFLNKNDPAFRGQPKPRYTPPWDTSA